MERTENEWSDYSNKIHDLLEFTLTQEVQETGVLGVRKDKGGTYNLFSKPTDPNHFIEEPPRARPICSEPNDYTTTSNVVYCLIPAARPMWDRRDDRLKNALMNMGPISNYTRQLEEPNTSEVWGNHGSRHFSEKGHKVSDRKWMTLESSIADRDHQTRINDCTEVYGVSTRGNGHFSGSYNDSCVGLYPCSLNTISVI